MSNQNAVSPKTYEIFLEKNRGLHGDLIKPLIEALVSAILSTYANLQYLTE